MQYAQLLFLVMGAMSVSAGMERRTNRMASHKAARDIVGSQGGISDLDAKILKGAVAKTDLDSTQGSGGVLTGSGVAGNQGSATSDKGEIGGGFVKGGLAKGKVIASQGSGGAFDAVKGFFTGGQGSAAEAAGQVAQVVSGDASASQDTTLPTVGDDGSKDQDTSGSPRPDKRDFFPVEILPINVLGGGNKVARDKVEVVDVNILRNLNIASPGQKRQLPGGLTDGLLGDGGLPVDGLLAGNGKVARDKFEVVDVNILRNVNVASPGQKRQLPGGLTDGLLGGAGGGLPVDSLLSGNSLLGRQVPDAVTSGPAGSVVNGAMGMAQSIGGAAFSGPDGWSAALDQAFAGFSGFDETNNPMPSDQVAPAMQQLTSVLSTMPAQLDQMRAQLQSAGGSLGKRDTDLVLAVNRLVTKLNRELPHILCIVKKAAVDLGLSSIKYLIVDLEPAFYSLVGAIEALLIELAPGLATIVDPLVSNLVAIGRAAGIDLDSNLGDKYGLQE